MRVVSLHAHTTCCTAPSAHTTPSPRALASPFILASSPSPPFESRVSAAPNLPLGSSSPLTCGASVRYMSVSTAGHGGLHPVEYATFLDLLYEAITHPDESGDLSGQLKEFDDVEYADLPSRAADKQTFREFANTQFPQPRRKTIYSATTSARDARMASLAERREEKKKREADETRRAEMWSAKLKAFAADPMASARAAAIAKVRNEMEMAKRRPPAFHGAAAAGGGGGDDGGGSARGPARIAGQAPVSHLQRPQPRPSVNEWLGRAQQWLTGQSCLIQTVTQLPRRLSPPRPRLAPARRHLISPCAARERHRLYPPIRQRTWRTHPHTHASLQAEAASQLLGSAAHAVRTVGMQPRGRSQRAVDAASDVCSRRQHYAPDPPAGSRVESAIEPRAAGVALFGARHPRQVLRDGAGRMTEGSHSSSSGSGHRSQVVTRCVWNPPCVLRCRARTPQPT